MRRLGIVLASAFSLASGQAFAWWDMGHKEIAALAYGKLTPAVHAKVDGLIKHHLAYPLWIKGMEGLPADEVAQAAFVNAAVWADDIKAELSCRTLGAPGCYQGGSDDPVGSPQASRNLGTVDHLIHDYWHYFDIPFSQDGTQTKGSPAVNALSQIKVLPAALSDPKSSEDLKSFDLVWLLHLLGDAHQPLHATQRFSKDLPDGDRGGNGELVDIGLADDPSQHAVWDGMLGDSGPASAAIAAAATLPPADPTAAETSDPQRWFEEGFEIAKKDVYASEIGPGKGPYRLSAGYLANARTVAQARAAVPGARLANLINGALKWIVEGLIPPTSSGTI
ncbi:S1/P1 nuclease [Rhizobium viscosum]|uniref:S1/P1 nuclease n=1 Tax=Rhizobium viscosum TaxID=1673 RepID=A0ABR9IZQ1_RHIVS|nr:S1/P1 nuclease [Rhizobium viscosum]MBE1508692.1 hypothetical protein [Rhizobium viscosum]